MTEVSKYLQAQKARLRILMISGAFYPKVDGSVMAVANIAEELARRGDEVTLLTRGYDSNDSASWNGIPVERVHQRGFSLGHRLWLAVDQTRRGVQLHRRKRFDVIHAHGFASLFSAAVIGLVGKVPVVVTFHGLQRLWSRQWNFRSHMIFAFLLPFEGTLARRATFVVAQSEKLKTVLIRLYGIRSEAVIVFPNPVDTRSFPFCEPSQSRTVLFVGTIGAIYAPDILVRAARMVLQRVPDAKFVLVGTGPAEGTVKRLAEDESVASSVRLVGRVTSREELRRYYASSRMLVIPFRGQGGYILTLAALESMSVGRPVIIGYEVDQSVGVISTASEPLTLSKQIVEWLQLDDKAYSSLSRAARSIAEGCSSEVVARRLEETYCSLARSGFAPSPMDSNRARGMN
jgi:glycosyltransferase involved in cell wall biosynthesis